MLTTSELTLFTIIAVGLLVPFIFLVRGIAAGDDAETPSES